MSSPPFRQVKRLVNELRELTAEEQRRRLRELIQADPALAGEVESVLEHAQHPPSFLERPVGFPAASDLMSGEAPSSAAPERIGDYRIRRRIATGGMGAVYEAEQEHPQRIVALKTIRSAVISEQTMRRFQRECALLGRLQHPGIAQIFEASHFESDEGTQPFFVMEYVEGRPITQHADRAALSLRQRLELFLEVCEAVHHAHERGVVHRDLKPDNILVQPDGKPKVLDFGVARATGAESRISLQTEVGQIVGTLPYMSPEQLAPEATDPDRRSDVYALGVLLYELLGRRLPFDVVQRPLHDAARILREEDPVRLSILVPACRGDLETIVEKALAKEVKRRYPDGGRAHRGRAQSHGEPADRCAATERHLPARQVRAAASSIDRGNDGDGSGVLDRSDRGPVVRPRFQPQHEAGLRERAAGRCARPCGQTSSWSSELPLRSPTMPVRC